MKFRLPILCALLVLACVLTSSVHAADWMWARGSIHTHTNNSDGDSAPQMVADWYKDHGYQFLVISDHERLTDSAPLDKPDDGFVLVPGEELALAGNGLPVHANAIGITTQLKSPGRAATQGRGIRNLVDLIREGGGLPMVNHPNWMFSLGHRDLLQVRGTYLLEIANMSGEDDNHNAGTLARLSNESVWDVLLSNGQTVYAAASDDMHHLNNPKSNMGPGKGWVVTRVKELTPTAVMGALNAGDFYASNGVQFADYSFDGREFKVKVTPKPEKTYVIRFVGKWGSILQETDGTSASYKVGTAAERNSYIRCKVICSDGTVAWTQAHRIPQQARQSGTAWASPSR